MKAIAQRASSRRGRVNFLVTGASGFIGLNLLERLLASGHSVTAFSADELPRLAVAEFSRLPGKLTARRADVRDVEMLEDLFRSGRIDAVLAGAAITAGLARERETPGAIFEVNLVAVATLVALAAKHGVRRVVALSSSAAMGERLFGETPVTEEDRPEPVTLYGQSKAGLESFARRWATLSPGAPEIVVARVSAVFGPWERATGVRDSMSPQYALARAAVQRSAIAPLPEGGERDWIHAPYVAASLEWMLSAPRVGHCLYNVGAGRIWHAREFIAALAGNGVGVDQKAGAAEIGFNDDLSRRRSYLDTQRLAREFEAPPAIDAATHSYARWVAAHPEWFAT